MAKRTFAPTEKSQPTPEGTAEPLKTVEERIRRRAYDLYELRGRVNGNDLDDWLQAETEVLGTAKSAAAA